MMGPFCASTRSALSRPRCALPLLMTLSRLPVLREGYSSGKLHVSGIPRNPSDMHTTGGSFYLFWLGYRHNILSSDMQAAQVLTSLPWCTDPVLPVLQNRTEKRFLGFFTRNISVHSRENLIPDNKASYFHSILL